MELAVIRELALSVIAVAGAAAILWKMLQWAGDQVVRARKITALVAEVPALAAEITKVSIVLTSLVNRFDNYVEVARVRESLALAERDRIQARDQETAVSSLGA